MNLYLERLKRMTDEQLSQEVDRMGKTMEKEHPLSRESKARCMMCFSFCMKHPHISEDSKQMLKTALKVLKLL